MLTSETSASYNPFTDKWCKTSENYQNVPKRHKVSKQPWENGADKLAWCQVATNFQCVKYMSAKSTKTTYSFAYNYFYSSLLMVLRSYSGMKATNIFLIHCPDFILRWPIKFLLGFPLGYKGKTWTNILANPFYVCV